jgi:hypothetical protein
MVVEATILAGSTEVVRGVIPVSRLTEADNLLMEALSGGRVSGHDLDRFMESKGVAPRTYERARGLLRRDGYLAYSKRYGWELTALGRGLVPRACDAVQQPR